MNVIILDDDFIFRDLMRRLISDLKSPHNFDVVGESKEVYELMAKTKYEFIYF